MKVNVVDKEKTVLCMLSMGTVFIELYNNRQL